MNRSPIVLLVSVGLLAGCLVDPVEDLSALDVHNLPCSSDRDCPPGWACYNEDLTRWLPFPFDISPGREPTSVPNAPSDSCLNQRGEPLEIIVGLISPEAPPCVGERLFFRVTASVPLVQPPLVSVSTAKHGYFLFAEEDPPPGVDVRPGSGFAGFGPSARDYFFSYQVEDGDGYEAQVIVNEAAAFVGGIQNDVPGTLHSINGTDLDRLIVPGCGGECDLVSSCSCHSSDPCGFVGDGLCQSGCALLFLPEPLDESEDCAPAP